MEREEPERVERERLLSVEDGFVTRGDELPEDVLESLASDEDQDRGHFLPVSEWSPLTECRESTSAPSDVDSGNQRAADELNVAVLEAPPPRVTQTIVRRARRSRQAETASAAGSAWSRYKRLASLPLLWLSVFLALGLGCAFWSQFGAGDAPTPSAPASAGPKFTYKPIEQIQVGDWVLAENPELADHTRDEEGRSLDDVL